MCYLTELAVQKERCRDFHPDRNTATKGGSLPGIFYKRETPQTPNGKRQRPNVNHHASNCF
jgi:hypothetical protein